MKVKNWTLDDLIDHLKLLKSSTMFDHNHVIRVHGELYLFNGESKDGSDEQLGIW